MFAERYFVNTITISQVVVLLDPTITTCEVLLTWPLPGREMDLNGDEKTKKGDMKRRSRRLYRAQLTQVGAT